MTIPKKKSRPIQVDHHQYRWMVKRSEVAGFAWMDDTIRLTVENNETGELHQTQQVGGTVTPGDVREFILDKFAEHK